MKAKALQFGRALSAALFVLLLSVAGMKNAFGQQTLVATLQHGEDLSIFYGMDAFVNAHAAAEAGDVITLSSGSFNSTTITKAITLRGAGFVTDTVSGTTPTVFNSAIIADVSDTENYLTIEGIKFNSFTYKILNNPHFYKCYFNWFYNNQTSVTASQMTNAHFVNCRVKSFYFSANQVFATNTSFINCVVWNLGGFYSNNGSTTWYHQTEYIGGSVVAINSIIRLGASPTAMNAVNSIVIGYPGTVNSSTYYYSLSGSSMATNCIGIKYNSSNAPNPLGSSSIDSWLYTNFSSVFKATNTELYYHEHFDVVSLYLKEEIANTCLGTDGTQVGIYGGVMPYTDHPAYMVIRHCNVANQTDAENKLSVEIEVLNDGE